eukprot:CAMPEP_0175429384 /NCGR_PEP_ID=MMETSP0095-20121207/51331_1 /TAXON_ID=311494 /ORGANISM="Alexandrium monilatum, Strain CCMP3105" /LENGTH=267 /DNA_ID=CAMNT_0016728833 /DNA_START=166 /DNA_END=966 /DNA_ORIENTATION=+
MLTSAHPDVRRLVALGPHGDLELDALAHLQHGGVDPGRGEGSLAKHDPLGDAVCGRPAPAFEDVRDDAAHPPPDHARGDVDGPVAALGADSNLEDQGVADARQGLELRVVAHPEEDPVAGGGLQEAPGVRRGLEVDEGPHVLRGDGPPRRMSRRCKPALAPPRLPWGRRRPSKRRAATSAQALDVHGRRPVVPGGLLSPPRDVKTDCLTRLQRLAQVRTVLHLHVDVAGDLVRDQEAPAVAERLHLARVLALGSGVGRARPVASPGL